MSFLVGFVLVFDGKSLLTKCLNFDGLSRQGTIEQHFPVNCAKIGLSFTTCLAEIPPFALSQQTKNSIVDLLKLAVTEILD